MIRLLVIIVIVLLVAPAFADPIKTPADLVGWLHKRLYPSKYVETKQPEATPVPPERPAKFRPTTRPHRPKAATAPIAQPDPPKVERAAGPPKPRAKPRKAKPRAVAKPKARVVQRGGGVSASDCARLRRAYAKYGNLINMGGEGYSAADVAYARRECRV
jgi:hypothetical protein